MKVLLTGAAGFIGFHLSKRLLNEGCDVIGIDNMNSYYDPNLKKDRLHQLELTTKKRGNSWKFIKASLEDWDKISNIFMTYKPTIVINLAAQAGVRYSLENPNAYIQSNLVGFGNIIEGSKNSKVEHLIYASSSSVYGGNKNIPFSENNGVNHPISLYAATKRSNELIAHTYSHIYDLPTTGLRFFTVYGPWGRPDMAPMIFAKSILNKKPIKVFNYGKMKRDFTYIDDIVEGVFRCCFKKASVNKFFNSFNPNESSSSAPYRVFNIGNSKPIELLKFIEILENSLGMKAIKEFHPMQPGDVKATAADTDLLEQWIDFKPSTSIEIGICKFAKWYLNYYRN
tara:strand:- start:199 stop:1221 length:1023 start_codon:yes stop_codon:yes gene_type:complete